MKKKKKEKPEYSDIDNKWELIGFVLSKIGGFISKNFVKTIILIIILGMIKGGCTIKNKFFNYTKDPIEIKKSLESKNNENNN